MADQIALRQRAGECGFSLIEMLVVVSILSILAVGVGLSATRSVGPGQADLAFFKQSFDRTRGLAVHGQTIQGLFITIRGQKPTAWDNGRWGVPGAERRWRGTVRFFSTRPTLGGRSAPQIVFLPNGQTSPFDLVFETKGGKTRCQSDGWDGLQCQPG